MIPTLCDGYLAQTNVSAGDMMVMAQIYVSLGQIDKCISTLQLIMQRYPQDSGAYYGMARIRAMQNMTKASLDALETAIRLNPSYRDHARQELGPAAYPAIPGSRCWSGAPLPAPLGIMQ